MHLPHDYYSDRLEVQAKIRQLGRHSASSDRETIERDRGQLTALLLELKHAQQTAGVAELQGFRPTPVDPIQTWDEIINEPVPTGSGRLQVPLSPVPLSPALSQPPMLGRIPVEEQLIPLPSNGNVADAYCELELSHRILHAGHHLHRIRDLIAEKSFQYSHVIRNAPRKSVNTHSRAAVKKLNLAISVHCRLYTQCQSRLLRLGADSRTQSQFRALTPDDVKASTAVINPNEPGSTRLKLSWIWQTAGGHRLGLASSGSAPMGTGTAPGTMVPPDPHISECKYDIYNLLIIIYISIVRRVHWLRARAQLMRWREEVTLTGYEMQWTVRYLLHMRNVWDRRGVTGTGTGTGQQSSAGVQAYARRKYTMWEQCAITADHTFATLNTAYQSPL